jgi:hypothetical protein
MQRSLLAPGCEKAPGNPDVQYVPPNSAPYKVTARDSWWTLADRPEVKAAKLSALDLCVYNFRTRNPAEINWYLRNKVGCTTATADRKNYKFSDDASPGIVYLPTATSGKSPIVPTPGDPTAPDRVPGSNPVSGVEEFTIDKESKIFSFRYVRARVKITGKLTVNWGSMSPDLKLKASAGLTKREFGLAGEAQLSQDLSVQYGIKMKAEDAKNAATWKKALAEASEVTIKRKLNNALIGAVTTGFRAPKDGLFYVVKITSNDVKLANADLSWLIDLPPGATGITAKGNLEISIVLGPGEAQLQFLANPGTAALGGLFAWIAFAGYGIANTMNKADRLAFQTWYVTGYVDAVFPPHGGANHVLPSKPEDRKKAEEMMRLGRQDAELSAREKHSDDGMPPMQAYRLFLLAMLNAQDDPYAERQARGLLRDQIHNKLLVTPGVN